ncbi:MAG: hypothetical protein ABIT01_12315, partial [Thermoanaerobaculia bacterium]
SGPDGFASADETDDRTAFTSQLSLVKQKVAQEQRRIELEEGSDDDDAASRVRRELPPRISATTPAPTLPEPLLPTRRPWLIPAFVVAAAVVGLIAFLVVRTTAKPDAPAAVTKNDRATPAPLPSVGTVRLTAAPWGEVLSVYDEKANRVLELGPIFTPARIELPPGAYTIRVRGETGRGQMEAEKHVEVFSRVETPLHIPLKGFEPDEVIRSLIP